jgi:transmembrane sensor
MKSHEFGAPDTTAAISDEAAQWWVTLHDDGCSTDEHRAFAEWVSRSPERVEAYLRLASLHGALRTGDVRWPDIPAESLIEEARAASAEVIPLERKPPFEARGTTLWQRLPFQLGRGFAAGIAAVLTVVIAAVWTYGRGPESYHTALGEQRSVILEDSSLVTLNTLSRVEVDFRRDRRVVRLVQGEALFKVAHDSKRPFEVIAGSTVIRAVGTRFNVNRRGERTTVTVLEGRVVVQQRGPDLRRLLQKRAAPMSVAAAERVIVTASEMGALERVKNVAPVTAWTQRRLVFDDRPIGEVADEFNRYNRLQVRIVDPALRREKITGVFDANDPESFLTFLSHIPDVRIDKSNTETASGHGLVAVRVEDSSARGGPD